VKLSGQCGRLKCCLNYELDTYMEALKGIPEVERPLLTEKGEAKLQKTDIFKRIMWFGYQEESTWIPLTVDQVKLILELNKQGIRPADLVETETKEEKVKNKSPENLEIDIKKFDRSNGGGRNFTKKKKKKPGNNTNKPVGEGQSVAPHQGQTPQAGSNKPTNNGRNTKPNPNSPNRRRHQ
jgi:hypothetical protein